MNVVTAVEYEKHVGMYPSDLKHGDLILHVHRDGATFEIARPRVAVLVHGDEETA